MAEQKPEGQSLEEMRRRVRGLAVTEATTQRYVEGADNLGEFVERLYLFALNREVYYGGGELTSRQGPKRLPSRARQENLAEAVAELITTLMEKVSEVQGENSGWSEVECAHQALIELRRPNAGARLHKRAGFRHRVVQSIMKEVTGPRAPNLSYEPAGRTGTPLDDLVEAEETAAAGPMEPRVDGIGDVSERLLEAIRGQLERAWLIVRDEVVRNVSRQPKTMLRRRAIVEVLADLARAQAPSGVVADHFQTVVEGTPPRTVVEEVRRRDIPGLKRVKDKQLREDLQLVKKALLFEMEALKKQERELRTRFLAEWARDYTRDALAFQPEAEEG